MSCCARFVLAFRFEARHLERRSGVSASEANVATQVSWQDQFIDTDESEPSADFATLAEKMGITATTPDIPQESARATSSTDTLLQDVMRDLRVEIDRKVLKGLYEGLSPCEIAHETGEKQATIRKRIQRLRAKLRNHPAHSRAVK